MLTALAIICTVVGIIGAVVPGLPGPPVSWVALLLLAIGDVVDYSATFLIVMGLIAAVITVLDYVVPIWGTKKFGGSKAGAKGSTIGLIISVFVLPILGITIGPMGLIGILAGPFVGAYIGETRNGTSTDKAFTAAFGSFVGFLAGTLMKLAYTVVVAVYVFKDLIF